MQNNLIDEIAIKISAIYKIDIFKAKEFAKDLVAQTEAHGGNPENTEQIDKAIDIVVRRWIEKGY